MSEPAIAEMCMGREGAFSGGNPAMFRVIDGGADRSKPILSKPVPPRRDTMGCRFPRNESARTSGDPISNAPLEAAVFNAPVAAKTEPVVFRKPPTPQKRYVCLQKWEGAVLEVQDEFFRARLFDLSNPGVEEEAEFDLEEISPEDRPFIESGAIFYWSIGYQDSRSGRLRTSDIRFRRLPAWTQEDIDAAARAADETSELIGW